MREKHNSLEASGAKLSAIPQNGSCVKPQKMVLKQDKLHHINTTNDVLSILEFLIYVSKSFSKMNIFPFLHIY